MIVDVDEQDYGPDAARRNEQQIDIGYCTRHSRYSYNVESCRLEFRFDYEKAIGLGRKRKGQLNEDNIAKLVRKRQWRILMQPIVMHYVNEKLLQYAVYYLFFDVVYALFVTFLSLRLLEPRIMWRQLTTSFFGGLCLWDQICMSYASYKVRCKYFSVNWKLPSRIFFLLKSTLRALPYIVYVLIMVDDIVYLCARVSLPDLILHEAVLKYSSLLAVSIAHVNLLCELRETCFGLEIETLWRICKMFFKTLMVWIPILLGFSLTILMLMSESEDSFWKNIKLNKEKNGTLEEPHIWLLVFVKTLSMTVGEIESNALLSEKQWPLTVFVLVFELVAVVILMSLVTSVAVGEVAELRREAQHALLKIQVEHVLQMNVALNFFPECLQKALGLQKDELPQRVLRLEAAKRFDAAVIGRKIGPDRRDKRGREISPIWWEEPSSNTQSDFEMASYKGEEGGGSTSCSYHLGIKPKWRAIAQWTLGLDWHSYHGWLKNEHGYIFDERDGAIGVKSPQTSCCTRCGFVSGGTPGS